MNVAPAELLFTTETAKELSKRGIDVDHKTLSELIRPHEEYSGSDLIKLGFVEESKIATQHHNYKGLSSGASAEILHLADVEQAMKAHRGYKQAASNVAAMAVEVHDAELGRIKNTDLVVVWVRDGMERLALDPQTLKEIMQTPTEHAHLGAVIKFLNSHSSVHLGTHTVQVASFPEALLH